MLSSTFSLGFMLSFKVIWIKSASMIRQLQLTFVFKSFSSYIFSNKSYFNMYLLLRFYSCLLFSSLSAFIHSSLSQSACLITLSLSFSLSLLFFLLFTTTPLLQFLHENVQQCPILATKGGKKFLLSLS